MPKRLRVYLDTSVFGGCFDAEFDTESMRERRGLVFCLTTEGTRGVARFAGSDYSPSIAP